MATVTHPEWTANSASCLSLIIGSLVLKKFLNPACVGFSKQFFSRYHVSLAVIIFSVILVIVAVKDIGLYELMSPLYLPGFKMGLIIENFQLSGMTLVSQDLFKTFSRYIRVDSGDCLKNTYGISSWPGEDFVLISF